MKLKDYLHLLKVIEVCAKLRGVDGLEHRTIYEFAWFLQEMEKFLVYGKLSKDRDLCTFQKMIVKELYDPDNIMDYVKLFEFYCQFHYNYQLKKRENHK